MRRILWLMILFGAYVWMMTSGNDRTVLKYGKSLYESVVAWLDDAEIDYQTKPNSSKKKPVPKKRSRRWD